MADDFDPHDYRSVKNKFEGLVLAAAAKGKPDEAVAFAVEHTKDAPSLVGVLRTRMDKLQTRAGEDGLKKRMSVFVLIDGICQKEVAAGKREYQHELEPHMDTLVSAVLEADRLEKLDKSLFAHFEENLRGARRILDSWRTKGIFIGGSMLDRWINQTELVGKEFMRRKAEAEPDPKRILRKMEEDRDKVGEKVV